MKEETQLNLIENLRKAVKICDSNKTTWSIVILSIAIGISMMFCYVSYIDEIPQNVSYSNNFSIPRESILIEEFSDIRIEIVEGESNLIYGKGGIPIVPKTLNPKEFEIQEFSRYYYTIQNSESGFAEVKLFLYGISGKDVYQTSYTYNAGLIIAKENSFGPLDPDSFKVKPDYDVVNFEFDKTGEIVDFTISFEHDNRETWLGVVIVSSVIFGVLTFFIIAIADAILIALLSIAIHIAKYREHRNKKGKVEE